MPLTAVVRPVVNVNATPKRINATSILLARVDNGQILYSRAYILASYGGPSGDGRFESS